MRRHWQDLGLALAALEGLYVIFSGPGLLETLLWLNLIFLQVHQFEEYRFPGGFPRMLNSVMFRSKAPEKFPLNPNSALAVNVGGWAVYFAAAIFAERAIWLAIAVMFVNIGNSVAHALLFNVKGRTIYNPGMFSAVFLFLPLSVYFLRLVDAAGLASRTDWTAGIALGIGLSLLLLVAIRLMRDRNSAHAFTENESQRGQ